MGDKIEQTPPPKKVMPVDEVRHEQQQIVVTILRVAIIAGALATAVAVYEAYVDQRVWQIPFLIGAYFIIILVTLWRGVTYPVQVSMVLLVLYGLGIYELINYAQTGDALLFMVAIPILATLFLSRRGGWGTLALVILTLIAFAAAYILGYLSPYNEFSASINSWAARITLFVMLSLVLLLPQSHLFKHLVTALRQRSQAQASLQNLNRELDHRVRQRTAELSRAKKGADEARQAAEAANQAKSVFLANMSHELRTPLNSILGFSQLMQEDSNLTIEQKEDLDTINRSGRHLLSLINEVLDMSKIEAGRMALIENDFDLYDLLDDLESMFRVRVIEKGLSFILERTPSIPQYICADEGKLRQVLINLLGNAVKFTQTGQITLRVNAVDDGKGKLLFVVEDTGPGIAASELDKIFEPFMQSESVRQAQGGTGLGLAISCQFVQLMGGDLQVESIVGRGTIFRFDIQVCQADTAARHTHTLGRRVVAPAVGQPSLTAVDLADLPPDLLADFKQAVNEVNLDRTNQIIDQIRRENETLALPLAKLAENFRFDTLQSLLEEINP